MCEPREEYNRRMGSIENKFKVICQRYHELTQELAMKNDTIEQMSRQITQLQNKLSEANAVIVNWEKKMLRSEINKKVDISRTNYNNTDCNYSIETDPIPSTFLNISKSIPQISLLKQQNQVSKPSLPEVSVLKPILNGQDQVLDDVLRKIDMKIANKPLTSSVPTANNAQKSVPAPPVQVESRGLLSRVRSFQNIRNDVPVSVQNIKTLQSIWQERDNEIQKMDVLFENINNRLKDYEHCD